MANPFDDESGTFVVLINDEKQFSLWPTFVEVPMGWTPKFGPAPRQDCVAHIEANWTDMRPESLVQVMNAERKS